MALLDVNVVSTSTTMWQGKATMVVAPAADGEIGLLVGHSPLLSVLQAGRVRITADNGDRILIDVTGGFLSLDTDQVTVVADDAELVAQA
ncbi:ATP synthase F1 subcomplex epsilon subunit [Micrococcales bacterium KH10]|nr:ATP synthase F1 subcomplex epsilon subunit [Micrococcales bacterium KH10]